ncbi:tyrosine-type recombinase/integrase [Chitinimonas sp. JJ19]|uniref:tyrosine-type recombinase/integrase n=1 Tax=Chitinimonas sp. JJ19 TaxID=3109352 RepID=UPI00300248C5
MPLTDLTIRQAKPLEKPYHLADGDALYLEVTPAGGKRWLYRCRFDGKVVKLALGRYPAVSLSAAREKALEARKQLDQGINPSQAKKVAKIAKQMEATNSFEILAREWHTKELARWTPGHATRILDSLEADVFPRLGPLPITEITAPMILETVRKIEARGAVETASRVLQRIGKVMRYAILTARATHNPASDLVGALHAAKVQHRPALPRAELPEFFRRLESEQLMPATKIAMKLLILTFVRPGELRGARWEEFDLDRAEWRIPAERMKMRSPHLVPLSRQAIELVKAIKPLAGSSPLLFHATTDINRPMSENTLGYAMGRMGYQGTATPHGFRALASTVLNEEGFDPDIIERQLAHAERNKVRAAYHRAEYVEDRRKMMQWWADFLDAQSHQEPLKNRRVM